MVEGRPEGDGPATWARIGLAMALVPALDDFTWYGLGPQETYDDAKAGGRLGRHYARVEQLETPYVVPQENGQRSDVRWLTCSSAQSCASVRNSPSGMFAQLRRSTIAERASPLSIAKRTR